MIKNTILDESRAIALSLTHFCPYTVVVSFSAILIVERLTSFQ